MDLGDERLAGARLLLIEDAFMLRKTIRLMLELEGATVVEAGTAREGLEMVRRHPFDLVLTDLGLPDMAGPAVIVQIRAASQGRTPVAVLSGAHEDRLVEAVDAGADCAFAKPVDWEVLVAYLAVRTISRTA
jgi:DNA-binding response OmpR family regulator